MIPHGAGGGLDGINWHPSSYACKQEGKVHVNGTAQGYARCAPNPRARAMKGIFGEVPSSRILHAPPL